MSTQAAAGVRPLDSEPAPRRLRVTNLRIAAALLVVTAAVYAPMLGYSFIYFDDIAYVFQNPHVTTGLTRDNVIWAFTQPGAGTWKHPAAMFAPLTSLSYLVDFELFGLDPGPYHLANLVLHVLNTLLLFALLTQTTARPWRSACVAALFALHPQHVESVAWIAQRKDVLSTCFWMLATLAYIRYTRRPGTTRYALLLVLYVAALLSKAIVVTLPFALLLLDVWPLRRVTLNEIVHPVRATGRSPLRALLLEKLPLLLAAAGVCGIAFLIERHSGPGMRPMADRITGALVSYVAYLGQMVWPAGLAVFYPFEPPSLGQVIGSVLLLSSITLFALWGMRRYPYLLVGWLWYLGTLVPMIGVVQVASQARADRFTYIPSIGIFIMVAWGVPDLLARWRRAPMICATGAALALAACTVVTARQLPLWRDGQPLFEHTLAVTRNNCVAHFVVGNELLKQDRFDEAWAHFSEVLAIAARLGPEEPYYSDTRANLGLILVRRGDLEGAKQQYEAAVSANPAHGRAYTRLGMIQAAQGDRRGALARYREAVRVEPELAAAHTNLAIVLEDLGQLDDAISEYAESARLEPRSATSRYNWAAALAKAGRAPEAIEQFRMAVQLNPQFAEARAGLAAALAQAGQPQGERRP
jgi:Flp pilus assembly protein TadD